VNRKAVREGFAAAGVIASLIFVGYEIRQNTAVARAAAYQDIGFSVLETFRQNAHDPQLAALFVVANDTTRWDELSESDLMQLQQGLMGSMRAWEAIYRQVGEGILPPDAIRWFGYGLEPLPWWAKLWPEVRGGVPPDFAAFVSEQYGWQ